MSLPSSVSAVKLRQPSPKFTESIIHPNWANMFEAFLNERYSVLWIVTIFLYLICHKVQQPTRVPSRKSYLINKVYETARSKIIGYGYLFAGADMIDREYKKAKGNAFLIQTPGKQHTMITSQHHIKELNEAPLDVLSLHAVAKNFLQPKHTMHGFEWKDQRGVEGVGFVRALRSLLTSHLPVLLPSLDAAIADELKAQLRAGKNSDGCSRIPIFSGSKRLVVKANCIVFFGSDLTQDEEFVRNALQFPEDVFKAAEILRIMPSFIAGFISSLVTRGHRSSSAIYNSLLPIVERRLEIHASQGRSAEAEKPSDGIQWLIDTSPRKLNWSSHRLVGEIMAVWYGSVHTLAIAAAYAIMDLYSHEDCIEPLRREAEAPHFKEFQETAEGLPLLDSFLKESARVSAFESTGVRRQALSTFTFSDGLRISRDDWVCIPHRSMMRDCNYFENPSEFDAFRSAKISDVRNTASGERQRLVDASDKWLVWGSGRILCPGRFYAVLVLKLLMTQLLRNYDCTLQKTQGSRSLQWRSAVIPKASVGLYVSPRNCLESRT